MGTAAHKPWSDCRVSERIYFRAAGFLIFLVFAAGRLYDWDKKPLSRKHRLSRSISRYRFGTSSLPIGADGTMMFCSNPLNRVHHFRKSSSSTIYWPDPALQYLRSEIVDKGLPAYFIRFCFSPRSSTCKNTPAVANLTCLSMKRLRPPRDESHEISGLCYETPSG